MVKLAIPTGSGNFIIRDTAQVVASDPATLQALQDTWALYNRSAAVYVNDVRVFIDQAITGDFLFASQLNYSDAMPWREFLGIVDDGATPGGGGEPGGGGVSDHTYRLCLVNAQGLVDTGATYPACDPANPDACRPMQFANLCDAAAYAYAQGEIPYRVYSEAEAWDLVFGRVAIDAARIIPEGYSDCAPAGGGGVSGDGIPWGMLAIGAGLILLASKWGRS